MRVTGFWSAAGLVIGAFIIGDLLVHPKGTQAAGQTVSSLWKTTAQGASGQRIG